jgi:hypothetical protein
MKKLLALPILVGALLVLALPCVLPQLAGMLLLFLAATGGPPPVPLATSPALLILPLLVIGVLTFGNREVPQGLLYLL